MIPIQDGCAWPHPACYHGYRGCQSRSRGTIRLCATPGSRTAGRAPLRTPPSLLHRSPVIWRAERAVRPDGRPNGISPSQFTVVTIPCTCVLLCIRQSEINNWRIFRRIFCLPGTEAKMQMMQESVGAMRYWGSFDKGMFYMWFTTFQSLRCEFLDFFFPLYLEYWVHLTIHQCHFPVSLCYKHKQCYKQTFLIFEFNFSISNFNININYIIYNKYIFYFAENIFFFFNHKKKLETVCLK